MKTAAPKAETRMASLFFATMFPQTVVSMLSLAPPVMAKEITASAGLPVETAGFYTGLVYAFVLAGNMATTRLIGRFGPLRLSFACVVTAGIGLAAFATGWLPALVLGTLIIGLSYGPLTPASSQVIAVHAGSPAFALIVSIRQTSVPLGGFLAGLLAPSLVLRFGWQATCEMLGLASALAAALFALGAPIVRGERRPAGAPRGQSFLAPLFFIVRRRNLLTLAGASFIFAATQLILSAFLVAYLVSVVGHDFVTAGALLGASQLAGVAGRILWGTVADRMRAPRRLLLVIGFGMALSCVLTGLLAAVGPTPLSLLVAILFGATASGWNGVFLAEVMREAQPAEAGLATSGSLLFTYAGVVVGPPAFGGLAAAVGLPAAYGAAALFAALGAVLSRPARRPAGA